MMAGNRDLFAYLAGVTGALVLLTGLTLAGDLRLRVIVLLGAIMCFALSFYRARLVSRRRGEDARAEE
jgi:positive regulator of sigma E activity